MRKGTARKFAALVLVPAMLAGAASPAQAQNSVSCVYLILRIYHAQMEACRQPLDTLHEKGYQRVRAMLEKFIHENAKSNPQGIIANVDAKVKTAPRPTCNSMEFARVKDAMESFTSPFGETQLRENLKIKRDPQAGACG